MYVYRTGLSHELVGVGFFGLLVSLLLFVFFPFKLLTAFLGSESGVLHFIVYFSLVIFVLGQLIKVL